MSLRRKLCYSLATLTAILGGLELAARAADRYRPFRDSLLQTLDAFLILTGPEPVKEDMHWPDRGIYIRRLEEERLDVVFNRGGREIPNAYPAHKTRLIFPEDIIDGPKRVFIVGGSAAFGFPYAYENTLTWYLDHLIMDRGYGVMNCSEPGGNTAHFVPIVRRLVSLYKPHTIVLFCGNNEWVHWQPQGQSDWSRAQFELLRGLARRSYAVAAGAYPVVSRISRRDLDAGERIQPGYQVDFELTGSDYALKHPLDARTPFDAEAWARTKRSFLDNLENNLATIAREVRAGGARLVLLTMPFNDRLSPAWKCPQPECFAPSVCEQVRRHVASAAKAVQARQFQEAMREAEAGLALDPMPPVLHYLKAQALEGLGRPREAEPAYEQCRENMIGNLGSMLSVNERIRRVAEREGAVLVDVKQLFDEYSRRQQRWFNEDLIHDDCHPTPLGHQLIAAALAEYFPAEVGG